MESDTCKLWIGSPAFQPPEVLDSSAEYSGFKVDVWAAGVTLYLMVIGKLPFAGDTKEELFESIRNCHCDVPPDTDPELIDLFRGIFVADPSTRLDTTALLKHKWSMP